MAKILISNTYPITLIRRRVVIEPIPIEQIKKVAQSGNFVSAWGHENTLQVAKAILGADITPSTKRPVLGLSEKNLPKLNGQSFKKVLLLNPSYKGEYRPQIGEEVKMDRIASWEALLIDFRPSFFKRVIAVFNAN